MLKKTFKLKSLEIKNLVNKKNTSFNFKIIRGDFFDIKIYFTNTEKKERTNFKCSVILSSKNFKKAVDRNKIKRQLYSILEKYKNGAKNQDISIIIYPKIKIKEIKFLNLEKEVYNNLNNFII